MARKVSRRGFLEATTVGAASLGAAGVFSRVAAAEPTPPSVVGKSKVRVGLVYLGRPQPGWPKCKVDLAAEIKRHETELAKLKPALADIEFVGRNLVSNNQQLAAAREKLKDVDGILAIHLTLGIGDFLKNLLELNVPVVLFSAPYSGHEWHIIASLQRQGKRIECLPSSDYADLAAAIRPIRAIRRLKEAKVLYLGPVQAGQAGQADPEYVKAVKDKFGTEIESVCIDDLIRAYEAVDDTEVAADARRWIREAQKIVEPSKEEIVKSSRMYLAMKKLLAEHGAETITIACLRANLIQRGLGYPCLGFARLTSEGLSGICEADLKSTMTDLIFRHLVGKPGFVNDPVIDLSNNTIICAHCVAPTHMDGLGGPAAPYVIRSHLEDDQGASLQVTMRTGQQASMARLIGSDIMLFSTGRIIDTPVVDRGCRTKITLKVDDAQRFLQNWSCGLHRVAFYGDHTRDLQRYCRLMNIRVLYEGIDDLRDEPGLEWMPHLHP